MSTEVQSKVGSLVRAGKGALLSVLSVCAIAGALAPSTASAYETHIGPVASIAQSQALPSALGAKAHLAASASQIEDIKAHSKSLRALEAQERALFEQEVFDDKAFSVEAHGSEALKSVQKAAIDTEDRMHEKTDKLISESFTSDVHSFAMELKKAGFYHHVPNDLKVSASVVSPDTENGLLRAYASLDFDRVEVPEVSFELPYSSAMADAKNSLVFDAHGVKTMAFEAQKRKAGVSLPAVPSSEQRLDGEGAPTFSTQSYLELITLHELAHIEHGLRANTFEHPKLGSIANSIISVQMSNDFQETLMDKSVRVADADVVDSVYRLHKEQYADVHMALSYLKLKGGTPEALQDLKLFAAQRQHNSALLTHQSAVENPSMEGYIDGYRTHDALRFVIDNAQTLQKMPAENISQAASFIASSYTHVLVEPLIKKGLEPNATEGKLRLNGSLLKTLQTYADQMQCSDCGVDTKGLLNDVMHPQNTAANSKMKSFAAKREQFKAASQAASYEQPTMSVPHFPTKKALGM